MCANHFRISYTYISYMSCNAAHTYNNHAMYATNQIDISSALTMNVAMNEQRPYLMSYVLHLQRGGGDREDGGDSRTQVGRFNCIFITHFLFIYGLNAHTLAK